MITGSGIAVISTPGRQRTAEAAAAALTRAAYPVRSWVLSTSGEAAVQAIAAEAAENACDVLITLIPAGDAQALDNVRAVVRAMRDAAAASLYELAGWVFTEPVDSASGRVLREIAAEARIPYEHALLPPDAQRADQPPEWLPVLLALGPCVLSSPLMTAEAPDGAAPPAGGR